MSAPNKKPTSDLGHAVAALNDYKMGSGRASLTPIDEAVCASLKNPGDQAVIEELLVQQLQRSTAPEARRYICEKLRMIGSVASVPALAVLLGDPEVGYEARATLELIPDPAAGVALQQALANARGNTALGLMDALGHRRDPQNLRLLEPWLLASDHALAKAAVKAIGHLGTPEAAKVLLNLLRQPTEVLRIESAQAALDCAEVLCERDQRQEAAPLCQELTKSNWPVLVREAAQRLSTDG